MSIIIPYNTQYSPRHSWYSGGVRVARGASWENQISELERGLHVYLSEFVCQKTHLYNAHIKL